MKGESSLGKEKEVVNRNSIIWITKSSALLEGGQVARIYTELLHKIIANNFNQM